MKRVILLLLLAAIAWFVWGKYEERAHAGLTVRDAKPSSKPDRGVVTFEVLVRNQRGEAVCQSEWATLIARRVGGPS